MENFLTHRSFGFKIATLALQVQSMLLRGQYKVITLNLIIAAIYFTINPSDSFSHTRALSEISYLSDSVKINKEQPTDTFKVLIIKPDLEESLKSGEEYYVRWTITGEKYVNNRAKLFLSTNFGKEWSIISIVDLSEGKYKWKVPDTIQTDIAKIKIEISIDKEKKLSEESKGFSIGKSEYLKDRVSVSTGVNFNYAADTKFNGLYFGINVSVPQAFKLWKPVGVDLYFAQGKIISNEKETIIQDTSTRISTSTDLEDQILYSAASLYFNFKYFQLIAIHSEFNRTSRSFTTSSARTTKRKINDTLIVDSRDTSFSTGSNSVRKNEFLLALPGVGFKFFNDKYYADIKAMPFVMNFSSDDFWYYIVRYRFGTNTSPNLSIGGNIKGSWGASRNSLVRNRNGYVTTQADEYDFPDVFVSNVEVFVYASIDVELSKVLDVFGLK
jgi:hypothetical protein